MLRTYWTSRFSGVVGFLRENPTIDIFLLSSIPFIAFGCVSLAASNVSRGAFFIYIGPAFAVTLSMARIYRKNQFSPNLLWMRSAARARGLLKLVHVYVSFVASIFAAAIAWPATVIYMIRYVKQQRDDRRLKAIADWEQRTFFSSEGILLATPLVAVIGSVLLYWRYLVTLDHTLFFVLDLTLAILAASSTHWIYLLNGKDVVTRLKETSKNPKAKFCYILLCDFLTILLVIAIQHAREAGRIPELVDFKAVYSSLTHVSKVAGPLLHWKISETLSGLRAIPYSAALTLFTGVPLYLVLIKTVVGGVKKQFERTDNDYISLANYQSLRGDFSAAEQSLLEVKAASAGLEGIKCIVQLGLGQIDAAIETAHKWIRMIPHASKIVTDDDAFWTLFSSSTKFPLPIATHLSLLRAVIRRGISPALLYSINFASYTNEQEEINWYELSDKGEDESCRLVLAWRLIADERFGPASRLLGEEAPSAPDARIIFITLKFAAEVNEISSFEDRVAYVKEWFPAVFPEYQRQADLLETGNAWEIFSALHTIQLLAALFSTESDVIAWLNGRYSRLLVAYGNAYGTAIGGSLALYFDQGGGLVGALRRSVPA